VLRLLNLKIAGSLAHRHTPLQTSAKMGRQPRLGLLRLLLRVALLLLVALAAMGHGAGTDYLKPIFAAMGSQRYETPPPDESRLTTTGDARVVAIDNPQVLASGSDVQYLDDVLAVIPAGGAPATATVAAALSTGAYLCTAVKRATPSPAPSPHTTSPPPALSLPC
jgi:hypothetical protein